MTTKERFLLLQDLCARFPYGLMVRVTDTNDKNYNRVGLLIGVQNSINGDCNGTPFLFNVDGVSVESDITEIKPYLRSLSSMTQEEKIDLCTISYAPDEMETIEEKLHVIKTNANIAADFYNKYHFDYRDLIPMGLALEAPEGMYNDKK